MQTLSTIDNHVALDQGCETLLENDRTHKSLEISDYVPESDSVYGGTKVLICMASDIPESLFEKNQLLVRFGLDHVPATRVSASVVKCTSTYITISLKFLWMNSTFVIARHGRNVLGAGEYWCSFEFTTISF